MCPNSVLRKGKGKSSVNSKFVLCAKYNLKRHFEANV